MVDATIWMATVLATAGILLLATLEETLRRRSRGIRVEHELRRGARGEHQSALQPLPVFVRVQVHHPRDRHAA